MPAENLKQLRPAECRASRETFTPDFSIDTALSGAVQEAECPKGNYVLIEALPDGNGGADIYFSCANCKLNMCGTED